MIPKLCGCGVFAPPLRWSSSFVFKLQLYVLFDGKKFSFANQLFIITDFCKTKSSFKRFWALWPVAYSVLHKTHYPQSSFLGLLRSVLHWMAHQSLSVPNFVNTSNICWLWLILSWTIKLKIFSKVHESLLCLWRRPLEANKLVSQ